MLTWWYIKKALGFKGLNQIIHVSRPKTTENLLHQNNWGKNMQSMRHTYDKYKAEI
jgi:hypothetical protein